MKKIDFFRKKLLATCLEFLLAIVWMFCDISKFPTREQSKIEVLPQNIFTISSSESM